ncbi:hypothetical protein M0802_005043 [Mischocyttarus mexicanus]|nr:hypothetical protein M0802_005043 [Mischocyttarus mexicanus]
MVTENTVTCVSNGFTNTVYGVSISGSSSGSSDDDGFRLILVLIGGDFNTWIEEISIRGQKRFECEHSGDLNASTEETRMRAQRRLECEYRRDLNASIEET